MDYLGNWTENFMGENPVEQHAEPVSILFYSIVRSFLARSFVVPVKGMN